MKKGLSAFFGALHEVERLGRDLLVDGLHALPGQRPGVGDASVVEAVDDAPRPELLLQRGILEVVRVLRLFLGVQVVEVAEELLEAVRRRQHLVTVAEVVLAELARHVALCLQQRGDGRVFLLHALRGARQADLGEARADRRLPGDERGTTGSATLLAIPVGEHRALACEAVDVRRPVTHHALVIGADVEAADVVTPDHEDVRLAGLGLRHAAEGHERGEQRSARDTKN